MKKQFLLFIAVILSALPLVGCIGDDGFTTTNPSNAPKITFEDLAANPELYSDKYITIDGFWFDGFEIAVLAERLEPSGFAPGNLKPGGVLIWIQSGLAEDVREQLYLQAENVTGYPAHYGKVQLTGKLEYGGRYGHLDSYNYRLQISDSSLIPWNPEPD
ncbi:MAG: hypothetical protein WC231_05110 [Dehalococcoidales bacterium]|jgi:hypothetical protein|nr:hypothetical protein [Dehalococcoidales bacterium]MDD5604442.1 hypothetical protein [Dehalococcoidales bacterium]NLE90264.1 hypothetical protein [Dehalococcoidales bacterium]